MMKQFFESFGDRRQQGPLTTTVAALRSRLRTATARDVELYAGVRYDTIVSSFPEDGVIDGKEVAQQIAICSGRGTPLGSNEMSPRVSRDSWVLAFRRSVLSMFQSCGGGTTERDHSPHTVRIL